MKFGGRKWDHLLGGSHTQTHWVEFMMEVSPLVRTRGNTTKHLQERGHPLRLASEVPRDLGILSVLTPLPFHLVVIQLESIVQITLILHGPPNDTQINCTCHRNMNYSSLISHMSFLEYCVGGRDSS